MQQECIQFWSLSMLDMAPKTAHTFGGRHRRTQGLPPLPRVAADSPAIRGSGPWRRAAAGIRVRDSAAQANKEAGQDHEHLHPRRGVLPAGPPSGADGDRRCCGQAARGAGGIPLRPERHDHHRRSPSTGRRSGGICTTTLMSRSWSTTSSRSIRGGRGESRFAVGPPFTAPVENRSAPGSGRPGSRSGLTASSPGASTPSPSVPPMPGRVVTSSRAGGAYPTGAAAIEDTNHHDPANNANTQTTTRTSKAMNTQARAEAATALLGSCTRATAPKKGHDYG